MENFKNDCHLKQLECANNFRFIKCILKEQIAMRWVSRSEACGHVKFLRQTRLNFKITSMTTAFNQLALVVTLMVRLMEIQESYVTMWSENISTIWADDEEVLEIEFLKRKILKITFLTLTIFKNINILYF